MNINAMTILLGVAAIAFTACESNRPAAAPPHASKTRQVVERLAATQPC